MHRALLYDHANVVASGSPTALGALRPVAAHKTSPPHGMTLRGPRLGDGAGRPYPCITLVTYLSEFALIWTALMAAWTTDAHDGAHHSVGVVRDKVGGAKAHPRPNPPRESDGALSTGRRQAGAIGAF